MGNLSENFNREEFQCKCGCGFDTVDTVLLEVLQATRSAFGVKVTINSGCRCVAHNRLVGGVHGSQHTKGRAADIVVEGINPSRVASWFNSAFGSKVSIGIYTSDGFVHVDTRTNGGGRWDG